MSSSLSGSEWFLGRWFILLLIVGLVETPLGLMKQISALRYTSLLAIFFALYLTVIRIYYIIITTILMMIMTMMAIIVQINKFKGGIGGGEIGQISNLSLLLGSLFL